MVGTHERILRNTNLQKVCVGYRRDSDWEWTVRNGVTTAY
jgi:hypothetical protein